MSAENLALWETEKVRGRPPKSRLAARVRDASRQAGHLGKADGAIIAAALELAARVEACPEEDRRGLAALMQQLLAVLDSAGLTPHGRHKMGIEEPQDDPLAAIIAARSKEE